MAMGAVGSTAWALVMTVTDPVPRAITYAEQPIHLETKAQCEEIAAAINSKADQAGISDRLEAKCSKIEYVEVPEQFRKKSQP
jgi:hypothetical protein